MLLQSHRLRDASTTIQDIGIKGFAYHAHQRQTQTHYFPMFVRRRFSQLCTNYTAHNKEIFTLCYNWATSKIVKTGF